MHRISVATGLCFALLCVHAPSPAAASGGSGGALAKPPAPRRAPLAAKGFAVAPATAAPGTPVTFSFRASGVRGRVKARVDLLAPGRPAVRARLGTIKRKRTISVTWTPSADALPAGAYTARLVISRKGAHAARVYERTTLTITPPPAPPATQAPATTAGGVFPVQGAYDFGASQARFEAPRTGHIHQGQDVVAAEGTPVVSPRAGTVTTVDDQAKGAGYYVVVRADDGRDYAFMHLQAGSTAVTENQVVTAGQPIGSVGMTGGVDGPHLHFEIWPDGWHSSAASQPIDPLPQLQAWAGAG